MRDFLSWTDFLDEASGKYPEYRDFKGTFTL